MGARARSTQGETPASPEGERVQKVVARAGLCSRRAAEELIREGRVTINGREAVLGDRVSLDRDAVKVDGRLVRPVRRHRYLLMNKPPGVVTTLDDPEGRQTVLDLLPPPLRKSLFPVGRLDYNTQGLLVLTTDGELAQKVSHPRYGCIKIYEVKIRGTLEEGALEKLRRGMVIEGRRTAPARVRQQAPSSTSGGRRTETNSWWQVQLVEGRTRQIREMFRRVGHPVQRLRRVAIGPIRDPRLPIGRFRELTPEEVDALRQGTPVRRPRGRG